MTDCWDDLHVGSGWQTTGTICTCGVDDRQPERTDGFPLQTIAMAVLPVWNFETVSYFFVLKLTPHRHHHSPLPAAEDDSVLKGIPNK